MKSEELNRLPGAEIVLPGLADLKAGRESVNACAVQAAASRLRGLGFNASGTEGGPPAAHRLYGRLSDELEGGAAFARYNAILERVSSFVRAAELARHG